MKRIHFLLLTVLFGFYSSMVAATDEPRYNVAVTDIDGTVTQIENGGFFKKTSAGGDNFEYGFDVRWNNGTVYVPYKEIAQIVYLEPGKRLEISFKDGRKNIFGLWGDAGFDILRGKSLYGLWEIRSNRIAKIDFTNSDQAGAPTAQTVNDAVILKNGDLLSGKINNTVLTLVSSYGTFNLDVNTIDSISFEGGGQNVDQVTLRVGDKLSGTIKDKIIYVTTSANTQISLEKEKIKAIRLKK
jgi:hypothetical protein